MRNRPTSYLPGPDEPPSRGCRALGLIAAACAVLTIGGIAYAFNRWPGQSWGAVVFVMVMVVIVAAVAKISK